MRRCLIAVLTTLPLLAACAPSDFPAERPFGDEPPREMPVLEPLGPIRAAAARDDGRTKDAAADVPARGARLRDRADALRATQP